MARIDGTIEWLVDDDGRVVGHKKRDGTETGIATVETNTLTGGSVIVGPNSSLELPPGTNTLTGETAIATEAALVAALALGGPVKVQKNAAITLTDSLVIGDDTTLDLNGATLTLAAATNKSPIKNSAFGATPISVTVTSSDRTATVTWASHGKTVGDVVSILGANQSSYNGVWKIDTVPTSGTFTYSMFEPASASPATGTVTARTANRNIAIVGGIIDMNEANQTVSGNSDTHAVRIFNCYGGKIDLEVRNAKKYAVLLANVDHFEVPHLEVDTASDGLHMMGPIGAISVGTVSGRSGDDLVAITLGDYATYEVCQIGRASCRERV